MAVEMIGRALTPGDVKEIEMGPKRVLRDYEVLRWFNQRAGGGTSGAAGAVHYPKTDSWSQGGWQGGGAYNAKPLCVHKAEKVMTLGGVVSFHPFQQRHVEDVLDRIDVWISCNGDQRGLLPQFVGEGLGSFATAIAKLLRGTALSVNVQQVWLNWNDRSIPKTVDPRTFWHLLVTQLLVEGERRKSEGVGPLRVGVSCIGSHGRTGTFLASVLATCGIGGEEAIQLVRDIHCAEAIETKEQEAYVKMLAEHLPQKVTTKVSVVKKAEVVK